MIKERKAGFSFQFGKKGDGGDWMTAEVVLMLVSIMLFVSIMVFISRSANSSLFYEELYAKEIGTLLEGAKPGQNYSIDITPVLGIAKSNKKDIVWVQENFFGVYSGPNSIRIKTTDNGGFEYAVFKTIKVKNPKVIMQGDKAVFIFET